MTILKSGERLIHYTRKPLTKVRSTAQEEDCGGAFKPCGLWVSVEGRDHFGWKDWCMAEGFGDLSDEDGLRSTLMYEIVLAYDAKVLRLDGFRDIDNFTREYVTKALLPGVSRLAWPDWERVALKYQGIVIAPYCYDRRLSQHTTWYYTWDCASGCIWDAAAVAAIKVHEPV